ncbi:hypothetical protein PN498_01100 [Oscillatoria sp. CS-180]|uniref:hypothetical protein n=1 Tax=Oscillatoria sp. CS-180 TaxID=3021720 RepID=UPI00232FF7CB|nr:hypothetical protein [Oscillatoria sp. CS-180]MDB9524570.1 hypothetical protein [Oscillatoria sp. CS-180]
MDKEEIDMNGISDYDFQNRVKPILDKTIHGSDEWEVVFSEAIDRKRILYPFTNERVCLKKYIEPLIEAANAISDTGCYLSEISGGHGSYSHAYIHLSELLDFFAKPYGMSKPVDIDLTLNYFILYSEHAKWALFSSFEDFALLGGVEEFMRVFEAKVPNLKNQTYEFLTDFRGDPSNVKGVSKSRSIIKNMLEHIYDASKAEQLLKETGW